MCKKDFPKDYIQNVTREIEEMYDRKTAVTYKKILENTEYSDEVNLLEILEKAKSSRIREYEKMLEESLYEPLGI